MSIAQDLIYQWPLQWQFVKSLAVNERMTSILNGFGHFISHSSVLNNDTALAEKSLNTSKELPERVMPGKFATVVVDNADFGGEAKYQTHITNTIVVQNLTEDHVFEKSNANKSRKKALKAPDINIDE